MNTKQNKADSPQNAAKTLNSELADNHTTQLEKAIVSAFVPYMSDIQSNNMAFVDGQHCLISTARGQIELFQSLANENKPREEVQIMAGSIVGFTEGLISQLTALEALTEALSSQIFQLVKERDQALEAVQFVENAGGWV